MELTEIRRKIEQLKQLELVAEADESRNVIKRQIEHLKLSELIAEAELNKSEAKPGEISTRDPITLKQSPISAALYGAIDLVEISGWQEDRLAIGSVIQIDTSDLLKSIDRDGILVPLVINENGIIISGCRRWKAALQLGLTSVPVEVRSFKNEVEEKQAILDYNRYREKTFSQKMREAELLKEIAGRRAKRKMLAGRRNPTLIFGEGYSAKRHNRETDAIVGARVRMGKDTFRRAEHIWSKAKEGDRRAAELIGALDEGTTSVNAVYTTLKKCENSLDKPELSRWQRLGYFAYFENGKLIVLDTRGELAAKFGAGTGFIQATQNPWNPKGIGACENVAWIVSGTDESGVESALDALINHYGEFQYACAVVVVGGEIIKVPQ